MRSPSVLLVSTRPVRARMAPLFTSAVLALALSGCGGGGSSAAYPVALNQPPLSQPPGDQTSVAEPPGAQPPATQPPPVEQPAVTQPPAVQPPAVQVPAPQQIKVQVLGLKGVGLTLQNNLGDDLAISADGTTSFSTPIATGASFQVSVKAPPEMPPQTCAVSSGFGQVAEGVSPTVSVTCNRPPHFAFATFLSSTKVLSVDETTGDLTPTSFSVAQGGIFAGTLAPSGRFLYLADVVSNVVRAYAINIDTGELAQLSGSPVATGQSQPQAMGISPDGKHLYAANRASNTLSVFAVDTANGALTLQGNVPTGTYPLAVQVSPDGRYMYVGNYIAGSISIYALNAATGAPTALGEFPSGINTRYLAMDPRGRFLYTTSGGNRIGGLVIDGTTGNLSAMPAAPFPAGTTAQNMVIDASGKTLYVTNETSATVGSYSIDPSSGVLTLLGQLPTGGLPEGVSIDPVSGAVYVAQQSSNALAVHTPDPQTGNLTAQRNVPVGGPPIGIAVLGFR
ncbi:MAG: beta-propeller fold lactonase family protein [Pseudomonadota bacterium]|nr:beta-propeller fold lactonase family protein [Pseudomonadota bacterium]